MKKVKRIDLSSWKSLDEAEVPDWVRRKAHKIGRYTDVLIKGKHYKYYVVHVGGHHITVYRKRRGKDRRKNRSIWEKLRHTKRKGIILGIVWFLILLFVVPVFEKAYIKLVTDISAVFYLASFAIGFYNAYSLTMWIDRRTSNTDFGIWLRRIVAGVMSVGGIIFAILIPVLFSVPFAFSSVQLSHQGIGFVPVVSFMSIVTFFSSFFLGISIFAGYIEFTYERKAGTIVFFGRTKY